MNDKIILEKLLKDCPKFWQNFVNSLHINPDITVNDTMLDDALKNNYNAVISLRNIEQFTAYGSIVPYRCIVRFATVEDLTLFMLAWN